MTIIVIGAGPAGMTAAISAKTKNNEVIILEKNSKCGKKLSLTGNGKGNYFNDDFSINNYFSNDINLLETIITEKNKTKLLSFFDTLGLIPYIKNGWYYPYSNKAVSLTESLKQKLKEKNITVIIDSPVLDIKKENTKFKIKTKDHIYKADKVILATGGASYPNTGSAKDSYIFAKNLRHSINKIMPALMPLKAEEKFLKTWHGVRAEATVSLYENGKLKTKEKGWIQLTDFGVSGICIFNLSGLIKKGLDKNYKETLKINFLPFLEEKTKEEVQKFFENRNEKLKNRTALELIETLIDYKLAEVILKKSNIKKDALYKNLTIKEKETLVENIINFNLKITDTKSFETAQTTQGGVPLKEVNITTMESQKVKGLYLIGEVLDCYGKCGGYNLSFAFLTGLLAGEDSKND